MSGPFFADVCNMLKREGVKINSGPKLTQVLTFGPPAAKTMKHEYGSYIEATVRVCLCACELIFYFSSTGSLEVAIEVVKDLESAIEHIHKFGSSHTDVIITENGMFRVNSIM